MNTKTLTIYSILIGLFVAALIGMQYLPSFATPVLATLESDPYMTKNGVRGMALERGGKLWTLNFTQQNSVVDYMNRGRKIGLELIKKDPSLFTFQRLIVYQFDKPDLIFTPVTIQDGNIVFEAPLLLNTGYIREGSDGKLSTLFKEVFPQ